MCYICAKSLCEINEAVIDKISLNILTKTVSSNVKKKKTNCC